MVCGLFEALSFEALLEDAGVAAALEAALVKLAPSHELQLAQGGRYPGLYRLLAHPNSTIRAIVRATRPAPSLGTSNPHPRGLF